MSRNPLTPKFRRAWQNLELLPLLTPEEMAEFWVEYQQETVEDIELLVENSASRSKKIVLTGHVGCGKSTLLNTVRHNLRDEYFVVFFSIADVIELSDVNHVNILFAIAVMMMEEAEKPEHQIKIKPEIKTGFYEWFAEETKTTIEEHKASVEGGFKFSGLLAWVKGVLQSSAIERRELKEKYERDISSLVKRLNLIATVIEEACGKDVFVIIDDIDKLTINMVRDIFHTNVRNLFMPNFRMIMTVPIAMLREKILMTALRTAIPNSVIQMPISKFFHKEDLLLRQADCEPDHDVVEPLKKILLKRITWDLIEPEVATDLVLYSGGVVRELLRLANECCLICLRLAKREPDKRDIKINADVFQKAVRNIRIDFERRLGSKDYEILRKVYEEFQPEDTTQQEFLDLLNDLYVLEYENDRLWYDIHPIVMSLVAEAAA